MTRQELEKKKGIKLSQREASPAEALISSITDNTSDKSKKREDNKSEKQKANNSIDKGGKASSVIELPETEDIDNNQKKDLKVKHYSIRLPEDMAEDITLAKIIHGDFSKYVRNLIQKDMEKNRDSYAELKARANALF